MKPMQYIWVPVFAGFAALKSRICLLTGALAVVGFPLLFLSTARVTLLQAGFIDPYVYAAYVHEYGATLSRFGATYYSTRVAYIFLEHIFQQLLGLGPGYYALRIVAISSAAYSAWTIAKRYYSTEVAIFSCAWLCLTPWLGRSLLWTYVDGIGTVYLLVALTLSLSSRRWWRQVLSGLLFALAINCNIAIAVIVAAFVPAWLYLERRSSIRRIARQALLITLGFISANLCLVIGMYLRYPQLGWFFEAATLNIAVGVANGNGAPWFVPLWKIIASGQSFYLSIPFGFAVISGILALKTLTSSDNALSSQGQRDFVVAGAVFLFDAIALVLALHVGIKVGWLNLFFYNVYLLPPCLFALIGIVGAAQARFRVRSFQIVVLINIVVICVLWLEPPAARLLSNSNFTVQAAFCLTILFLLLILSIPRGWTAAAGLVTGSTLLTFSLYTCVWYAQITEQASTENITEWDVYRGAVHLQNFVDANVQPSEGVKFWYKNRRTLTRLDSIQSMFLWGYTRLAPYGASTEGMPVIDPTVRKQIPATRCVVLLARTVDGINAGLLSLQAAGFPYQEVQSTRFDGQKWGYAAAIVRWKSNN